MRRLLLGLSFAVALAGPAAARDAYDCADNAGIPMAARWSPANAQIMPLIGDFYRTLALKEKFSIDMCGVTEDGKQMILVDALHMGDSKTLCGDPLNFAILYDPQTRKFGDPVPYQTLCGAKPPPPQ